MMYMYATTQTLVPRGRRGEGEGKEEGREGKERVMREGARREGVRKGGGRRGGNEGKAGE